MNLPGTPVTLNVWAGSALDPVGGAHDANNIGLWSLGDPPHYSGTLATPVIVAMSFPLPQINESGKYYRPFCSRQGLRRISHRLHSGFCIYEYRISMFGGLLLMESRRNKYSTLWAY